LSISGSVALLQLCHLDVRSGLSHRFFSLVPGPISSGGVFTEASRDFVMLKAGHLHAESSLKVE
jgi:hypothetical protein